MVSKVSLLVIVLDEVLICLVCCRWAFVFPNVGFTIAIIDIGQQLESEGVLWVGSAMTILIVITWISVFVCHVWAVLTERMMMPGMDEDKGEEDL